MVDAQPGGVCATCAGCVLVYLVVKHKVSWLPAWQVDLQGLVELVESAQSVWRANKMQAE